MSTPPYSPTVNETFFQPLEQAIATASGLWPCPELPDDQWLRMGVQRVLEASESGRGFLQEHGLRFESADIPELAHYACFAADGHWHKAATHDPRHEGSKMAVGHFYSLNLRTHTLRHLAAGQGLHEHDMSALKRIKPKGLRQSVAQGTRVLIIYDKAGIDFAYWKRCRQECAVYFISRVKENMVFEWVEDGCWDQSDARNHGVIIDCKVRSRDGHL